MIRAWVDTRQVRLAGRGFGYRGRVVSEDNGPFDYVHETRTRWQRDQARADAEEWARSNGYEVVDRSEVER